MRNEQSWPRPGWRAGRASVLAPFTGARPASRVDRGAARPENQNLNSRLFRTALPAPPGRIQPEPETGEAREYIPRRVNAASSGRDPQIVCAASTTRVTAQDLVLDRGRDSAISTISPSNCGCCSCSTLLNWVGWGPTSRLL